MSRQGTGESADVDSRVMDASEIRRRVTELGPWYQNIDLGQGITTKNLAGEADIFAQHDIPGPLWRAIVPDLGDLAGQNVLDIGCNAFQGYLFGRPVAIDEFDAFVRERGVTG